ncbi:hypothetical protein TrRE_jg12075 [Triparma retinervis]|uniref:URB1 C-terminal domain-containing protein n=1 Tax=Triparma retinervis TaxID=2557542 RepID=A0A9W6ZDJ6_9STRA|nr:hypothetical protein TrRE_jg12075 [Triparma retinervis]
MDDGMNLDNDDDNDDEGDGEDDDTGSEEEDDGEDEESESEDEGSDSEDEDDDDDDDMDIEGSGLRHEWEEDTANYNVPFVGTKIFSQSNSTSASSTPAKWNLQDYLLVSPSLYELLGPDLFPGSTLHTRTLTKTKKLRKLSIEIIRRHTECLAVLSFLLHHDSTISDDVKTKVGNLLKRKLLKGLTFKELIQAATAKSTANKGGGSNRRIQAATLNLLNSLIKLFSSKNELCNATPPYNVVQEIVGRMELGCHTVSNTKSSNPFHTPRPSDPNRLILSGSWLFRPEPNITTSKPLNYLRHSVSLSMYHLASRVLQSLLVSPSCRNKHAFRDVLVSASGSKMKRGFIGTSLVKVISLPKVVRKMSSKDNDDNDEGADSGDSTVIGDRYLEVASDIYESLGSVLTMNLSSSLQMPVSNRELSDAVIPRDALSALANLEGQREDDSNPASHDLLIKLLKPDTSPYYETDYSIRNVARTLTLLPGHSDPEVAEMVMSILQESPQVTTFFIRFFKVGELDITGSTGRKKKRKKNVATEHDEGLDLMINDGTGKQRTLAATENVAGIEADVQSLISAMSYLTSILSLPIEPTILKETKFDSFANKKSDPSKDNITYSLLEVISLYYSFLITTTQSSNSVKYDFTKLLPPTSDVFFCKPVPLQVTLLKTLHMVFSKKDNVTWTKSSLSVVFTILLESTPEISLHAKSVVMKIIAPVAAPLSFESYVLSCLLNSLSPSHVKVISEVIEDVKKNGIRHSMACAMAGAANADIPTFLTALLARLAKGSLKEFGDLVMNILGKALKFSPDPMPLCKVVKHISEGEGANLEGPAFQDALSIVEGVGELTSVSFSDEECPPFTLLRDVRETIFAYVHAPSDNSLTTTLERMMKTLGHGKSDDPNYPHAVRAFFQAWEKGDKDHTLFTDLVVEVIGSLSAEEIMEQAELKSVLEEHYFSRMKVFIAKSTCPDKDFSRVASPVIYRTPSSCTPMKSALFESLVEVANIGDWRMSLLEGFEEGVDVDASGSTVLGVLGVMVSDKLKRLAAKLIKNLEGPLQLDGGSIEVGEFLEKYARDDELMEAILGNNPRALGPYVGGGLVGAFFERLGLEEGMDIFGLEDYDIKILKELPGLLEGDERERMAGSFVKSLLEGVEGRSKVKLGEKEMTSEMGMLVGAKGLENKKVNTAILVRACSALPRVCRKKGRGDHEISKLLKVVEGLQDFEEDLVVQHADLLNDAALTMLRHGLGQDQGKLLELLRRVMKWNAGNKDGALIGYDCVKVFLLLTSHSSFEEAIRGGTEVLETVLLCLQMAKEEGKGFGEEEVERMVEIIMKEFGAGVSARDLLVRRILYALEVEFEYSRGTEDMSWKGVEKDRGGGWGTLGWFVGCVEERRVRATLGDFPVGDAVVPSDVAISDVGDEGRYSVGFLLPVALSFVESVIPGEEPVGYWDYLRRGEGRGEGRGEEGEEEEGNGFTEEEKAGFLKHSHRKERFISATRRMCENGTISLALASLCCKDLLARKMAVAILGIVFEFGLEDAEASKVTGWSARPQLALVVGSFLDGLMGTEEGGGAAGNVPKLPCAAALFLAHSFFIMGKPSSPMFGGINSYFLKQNGGRFGDLNAVPGFGQMFFGKERAERLWMMRLLAEGTKGNHDYQVMGRRHAHSLIMAVMDTEGANMEEKRLCLSVLESALANGGRGAVKGLLEGGLAGWMGVVGRRGWGEWGAGVKLKWLEVAEELVRKAREFELEGGGMLDVEVEGLLELVKGWEGGGVGEVGGEEGGGGEEEERVRKGLRICRAHLQGSLVI